MSLLTAPRDLQFDLSTDDQALFLAEVDELLQRVEESLVHLERAPGDQALLNEIFRAAHTIKGSSATIGHTRMAALTHAMETRLDDIRKGTASVTPQLIEALLKALDVLKLLRDEVDTHVAADVDVEAAAAAVERRAALRVPTTKERRRSAKSKRAAKPADTSGEATHRFDVVLEDGSWAAVRALQVLLTLGEHGRIVSSQPTQAEIERDDGRIANRLLVLVQSDKTEHELVAALNSVPELGSIKSETLTAAPPVEAHTGVPATRESAAAPVSRSAASTTVRIDVARLDALLNLVGELVIDRTRLVQLGGALIDQFGDERILGDLHQTALHIGRITDELQEQVMKSRMLPVEAVFNRLPRVVRDVAARQGKQVDFIVEGKDTELDRSVIEEIGDPLLHLIRNGVDHGIETPEQRIAAGKPPVGRLRLSAQHADSFIVIALEDDGKGVNVEAVKRKAVERGVVSQEQAERMSDSEAVQLIFAAGLSTAEKLTDVSGRGVGMDVVRANVEKINGSVEVESRPGKGTTFTVRLPLTLAIVQALLVQVAGGIYALPIHSVTETLRVEPRDIHQVNHREAIILRDQILPLVSVRNVFGLNASPLPLAGISKGAQDPFTLEANNTLPLDGISKGAQPPLTPGGNEILPLPETGRGFIQGGGSTSKLVVAVHTANRQVGLIVDALVGEQEIVIKPLGQLVGDVAGVSGAAILGDGNVALIVDVAALIAQAIRDNTTAMAATQGRAA